MLIQKLQEIILTLNELIEMTQEDIKNIKEANHEAVFKNTKPKEELSLKFYELKNEIDAILVARNKPIEEIFSKEEEKLFDEFRDKLNIFYEKHKHFSRLAISVANFYNSLVSQIKQNTKISYKEEINFNSNLSLKG
jgi:uncharacterized protein YdcH (DUF465 family)